MGKRCCKSGLFINYSWFIILVKKSLPLQIKISFFLYLTTASSLHRMLSNFGKLSFRFLTAFPMHFKVFSLNYSTSAICSAHAMLNKVALLLEFMRYVCWFICFGRFIAFIRFYILYGTFFAFSIFFFHFVPFESLCFILFLVEFYRMSTNSSNMHSNTHTVKRCCMNIRAYPDQKVFYECVTGWVIISWVWGVRSLVRSLVLVLLKF